MNMDVKFSSTPDMHIDFGFVYGMLFSGNYNDLSNKPIRMTTMTLPSANWSGSENLYFQVVNVNSVTENTKVNLQPTVNQIVDLQNAGISLVAENTNGTVTIYAIGNKPNIDYNVQALLLEVEFV